LKEFGYSLPKAENLRPSNLNHILKLSADRPDKDLIHTILLRTQSQAVYSPENIGHFGLALEKYAHFTSPIRRYADLLVHRSLARACKLGDGGLTDHETAELADMAEHISTTERRSMMGRARCHGQVYRQVPQRECGQGVCGAYFQRHAFRAFRIAG
jgi:ribonuclease R